MYKKMAATVTIYTDAAASDAAAAAAAAFT
jgi:hypothetical protein